MVTEKLLILEDYLLIISEKSLGLLSLDNSKQFHVNINILSISN